MVEPKVLPPHIRSKDSCARRCWGQVAALAPLLITACFTGHAEILRLLLLCLVSAVAFEYLAAKVFKTRESLRNGDAILNAVLFSLLLPAGCPAELVILGSFFGAVTGKAFWGGAGAYLFHPALLARVLLQVSFPQVMTEPMLFAGAGDPWTLASVILGGALFLKQKQVYWETPALFVAGGFLCEALWGRAAGAPVFFSSVLFAGFFLLADPVPTPMTRRGCSIFVLGAAFLSVGLGKHGFTVASAAGAILLMDLVAPWIDLGLKSLTGRKRSSGKGRGGA